MSVFSRAPSEWQRLDWQLFQNGAIALYFRPTALSEDIRWLRDGGYDIYEFDCGQWKSETHVHNDFKRVLAFPDYYGQNLDALSDCLSDLSIPAEGGAALVFHRFDVYAKTTGAMRMPSDRTYAQGILDIVASASRFFLLTGQRLVLLVQSNDPRVQFNQLGSVNAVWNPREWLDKNRGL